MNLWSEWDGTAFQLMNSAHNWRTSFRNSITYSKRKSLFEVSLTIFPIGFSQAQRGNKWNITQTSGEKWDRKTIQSNRKKESTIVNFIKLIFKEHTMKFLIGLQLLHPLLTNEEPLHNLYYKKGAKQKFNFVVLLSFNRFPFVWQKWDFSFSFSFTSLSGVFIFD